MSPRLLQLYAARSYPRLLESVDVESLHGPVAPDTRMAVALALWALGRREAALAQMAVAAETEHAARRAWILAIMAARLDSCGQPAVARAFGARPLSALPSAPREAGSHGEQVAYWRRHGGHTLRNSYAGQVHAGTRAVRVAAGHVAAWTPETGDAGHLLGLVAAAVLALHPLAAYSPLLAVADPLVRLVQVDRCYPDHLSLVQSYLDVVARTALPAATATAMLHHHSVLAVLNVLQGDFGVAYTRFNAAWEAALHSCPTHAPALAVWTARAAAQARPPLETLAALLERMAQCLAPAVLPAFFAAAGGVYERMAWAQRTAVRLQDQAAPVYRLGAGPLREMVRKYLFAAVMLPPDDPLVPALYRRAVWGTVCLGLHIKTVWFFSFLQGWHHTAQGLCAVVGSPECEVYLGPVPHTTMVDRVVRAVVLIRERSTERERREMWDTPGTLTPPMLVADADQHAVWLEEAVGETAVLATTPDGRAAKRLRGGMRVPRASTAELLQVLRELVAAWMEVYGSRVGVLPTPVALFYEAYVA